MIKVFNKFMRTTRMEKAGQPRQPTPVKTKIRRIEQGKVGSRTPGRPKGIKKKAGEKEEGAGILKQKRIKEFFEKKVKAQHLSGPDLGDNGNNKGATLSSPLLGVAGSPVHTPTSKVGRGSIPVARGGGVEQRRKEGKGPQWS